MKPLYLFAIVITCSCSILSNQPTCVWALDDDKEAAVDYSIDRMTRRTLGKVKAPTRAKMKNPSSRASFVFDEDIESSVDSDSYSDVTAKAAATATPVDIIKSTAAAAAAAKVHDGVDQVTTWGALHSTDENHVKNFDIKPKPGQRLPVKADHIVHSSHSGSGSDDGLLSNGSTYPSRSSSSSGSGTSKSSSSGSGSSKSSKGSKSSKSSSKSSGTSHSSSHSSSSDDPPICGFENTACCIESLTLSEGPRHPFCHPPFVCDLNDDSIPFSLNLGIDYPYMDSSDYENQNITLGKCVKECGGDDQPCCPQYSNTGAPTDCVCDPGVIFQPSERACKQCGRTEGDPCCAGDLCNFGQVCLPGNKTCTACGQEGQPCCQDGDLCDFGQVCLPRQKVCTACGGQNQPCCQGGDLCDFGQVCLPGNKTCTACGQEGQPCCQGGDLCDFGQVCLPRQKVCTACGGQNQPCCQGGDLCDCGQVCLPGNKTCTACGGINQPCCPGDRKCIFGRNCGGDKKCSVECGHSNQVCCTDGGKACEPTNVCQNELCIPHPLGSESSKLYTNSQNHLTGDINANLDGSIKTTIPPFPPSNLVVELTVPIVGEEENNTVAEEDN